MKLTNILLIIFLFLSFFCFSQTPQINSILVNACTVSEGLDELVVFTNGTSNLSINNITITFPSLTPYCNSGCGTQTLLNNATYVNSLNTLAGCTLFQFATTIPPGAKVIVFTGLTPSFIHNYSSECGNGPYYVIFCNNASTVGRFANNAGANRTLTINFGSSTDAVTFFSSAANTGTDGDYVSFTDAGVPTYNNIGTCAIPLPIELLEFKGSEQADNNLIQWSTASERDNDYYTLEKSIDGLKWNKIGNVDGSGTISQVLEYEFVDNLPESVINYYRLSQTDLNGLSMDLGIIAIDNSSKKNVVKIFNLLGQEVDKYYRGFVIVLQQDGSTSTSYQP